MSVLGALFKKQKTPPNPEDEGIQDARRRHAFALSKSSGRKSTILAGNSLAGGDNVSSPSLGGASGDLGAASQ
jgi:hypothetical protein